VNFVVVTQDEPFYVKYFFKVFIDKYPYRDEIKGVVIQNTFNKKSNVSIYRKAMLFYGFWGSVLMGLQYAFCKLAEVLWHSNKSSFTPTIKSVLRSYKVPVLSFRSVNNSEFLGFIKEGKISLVISVAASEIFKRSVLEAPEFGCINMHSGPLPMYKGMMPNFWTLFNKERYAYVTIHKMAEKIDDGAIIRQDKFEIEKNESFNSLARRSKEFGAELMVDVLKRLRQGSMNCRPNYSSQATYYTFPTAEQIKLFKKRGGRIL
jgi:methionyl-tRNA formyltransferase